jgi:hypothetical protein|tara:strand:- start:7675 stop:8241 length:567 start_codon:yes stop_codon:yes gene_type:complete
MNPVKSSQLFLELQDTLHAKTGGEDRGVLLSFSGELNSESTDAIMMLAENGLANRGAKRKEKNRMSNVLIECLQNVSRHGWIDDDGKLQLFLTIDSTPLGYQIESGNFVDFDMAAALRSNLSEVNGMTHEELRVRYVECLCNNEWSEKGGAGLGLLSMAKKSNGPLDYQFQELDSGMYLFTLGILIKG